MGYLKVFWRMPAVDSPLGISITHRKISSILHLQADFKINDNSNQRVLEIIDSQDYSPIRTQITTQCFREIYQLRLWFSKEIIRLKAESINSFMKWKTIRRVSCTFQGECRICWYQHNPIAQPHVIQITTSQMTQRHRKTTKNSNQTRDKTIIIAVMAQEMVILSMRIIRLSSSQR